MKSFELKIDPQTNMCNIIDNFESKRTDVWMTEKRFVYYEHKGADYILDTPNESLDFIEMLGDCLEAEEIVDLLNCLNDENEQLKSTIKEVIELLSEEVDLFTDKATEHDINAYIELKELDNKDAFYMAIATKKAIKMLKELEE